VRLLFLLQLSLLLLLVTRLHLVKKMIFVDRVSTCTLSLPLSLHPSLFTHSLSLYRTHKLRPS
jgi:hypothetical protein